jgi:hypothetical protein
LFVISIVFMCSACPPPSLLQNISFKDKRMKLESKEDRLMVKEDHKCDSEKEALMEVGGWAWGTHYVFFGHVCMRGVLTWGSQITGAGRAAVAACEACPRRLRALPATSNS